MRSHVHLHEGLGVGEVAHLFFDVEAAAVAGVVAEGHGVGKAVVEAGDGFGRGEGHPLAAFALQGDVAGLALHGFEIVVDARVVVDREVEAAVDGDAVDDAEAAGVGEGLLEREAALEVDVIVDDRVVVFAEDHGLAVEIVDDGHVGGGRCERVGQRADADVFEEGGAAGVVALQGEGAVVEDALEVGIGAEGRVGLDVVDDQHVVDADLDLLAADQDVHGEPFVVVDELLVDVADGVEGAGLLVVAFEGVGDLDFKAGGGKAGGLEGGVEVDAGVGAGAGHDVGRELEVLEVGVVQGAGVEEVRARAVDLDLAVDDAEGAFVLAGLPAVEGLAVEEGDPGGGVSSAKERAAAGAARSRARTSRRVSAGMMAPEAGLG